MSQVKKLENEPPPPIKNLVESEAAPHPNRVDAFLTDENMKFVKELAHAHQQPIGYVIDRLVEAAKWGVPYRIPIRMSPEMLEAIDWLNKRRNMESRAKMMMAKMRSKHESEKEL